MTTEATKTPEKQTFGPGSITAILAGVVVKTPVNEAPVATPVVYTADPQGAAKASDTLELQSGM